MALLDSSTVDIARIEWTEERLLRAAYLIELEKAIRELDPKNGVARWIATPNSGPFFSGNSPLQVMAGGPREMKELLWQVRRWGARKIDRGN
jgi:hypothetical protein